MKSLISAAFAATLLCVTAASASVGVGVHVGGVGAGVSVGVHDSGYRHHPRRCGAWAWRHHHREHYCRRWY